MFNDTPARKLIGCWVSTCKEKEERNKGNVLFNDTLNTFYLRFYDVAYMIKDKSERERERERERKNREREREREREKERVRERER